MTCKKCGCYVPDGAIQCVACKEILIDYNKCFPASGGNGGEGVVYFYSGGGKGYRPEGGDGGASGNMKTIPIIEE